MKKFNFDDYDVSNIGSIFRLKSSPDSNCTFLTKLALRSGELTLVDMGGYLFNLEDAPYLAHVQELIEDKKCQSCIYKMSKGTHHFNDRILCERHYKIELTLSKIMIRDFLYKINTREEYDIFIENYQPMMHNDHDLKFPCRIVLHKEYSEHDIDDLYTAYIINETMEYPI